MTNELEKRFFDTFGIECNISFHQQFNGAQVPRGLEFYKKREELAKTGIIKIWHKMLNPRPENDCVYWREYHYPQITDSRLLKLICILNKSRLVSAVNLRDFNYEDLKNTILRKNITILKNEFLNNEIKNEFKQQVRKLFEEEIFTK